MNRRRFVLSVGASAISIPVAALLSPTSSASAAPVNRWRAPPVDLLKKHVRPLRGGAQRLPSDEKVVSLLQRWLKRVRLASLDVSLNVDRGEIFQFSNLRPDTNGYVVRLQDARVFQHLIKSGTTRHAQFDAWVRENPGLDLPCASFLWLRQVRANRKRKPNEPPLHIVETYWLVIWRRVNGRYYPAIQVTENSIGFYRSGRGFSEEAVTTALRDDPEVFLDPQVVGLHWHAFAAAMQWSNNLFYQRACFRSAGTPFDVWGRSTLSQGATQRSRKGTFVYRSEGPYYQKPWSFQLDLSTQNPPHQYSGLETVFDLRRVPPAVVVDENLGSAIDDSYLATTFFEPVQAPRPFVLVDGHADGIEFIIAAQQAANGAGLYAGHSYFAVAVDFPPQGAAELRVRGSAFKQTAGLTASIPIASLLGAPAGTAVTVGGLAKLATEAYLGAKYNRRLAELQHEATWVGAACAQESQNSYDACRACVEGAGTIEEYRDIQETMAQQTAAAEGLSATAGGCVAGAIAGGFVGCGIGALIGLGVGALFGLIEYWEYRTEVEAFENEAFESCRELS